MALNEKIGKYRIQESNGALKVTYAYSFGDIFGMLFYILGLVAGILLLYVAFKDFTKESLSSFNFWMMLVAGGVLGGWFLYIIIMSLYNPSKGVLQVDKARQVMIVRDFLREETIPLSQIHCMYCKIDESYRPRQKFGMFIVGKKTGEQLECFIVRSSIPLDLGKRIEKDIYDTSRKLI
ncbi:MAG TPA: hypothetical protein VHO90_19420, partial [Bacteroidales bacterium]|nr:hypothetical protein [Bacteroidales bacterium]